jgi:hypothetical protein
MVPNHECVNRFNTLFVWLIAASISSRKRTVVRLFSLLTGLRISQGHYEFFWKNQWHIEEIKRRYGEEDRVT